MEALQGLNTLIIKNCSNYLFDAFTYSLEWKQNRAGIVFMSHKQPRAFRHFLQALLIFLMAATLYVSNSKKSN